MSWEKSAGQEQADLLPDRLTLKLLSGRLNFLEIGSRAARLGRSSLSGSMSAQLAPASTVPLGCWTFLLLRATWVRWKGLRASIPTWALGKSRSGRTEFSGKRRALD